MHAFHSYTDANKVTTKGLSISYTTSSNGGTYRTAQVFEVHRIATKSYAYVGMDHATAEACRAAKESQYTRQFYILCSSNGVRYLEAAVDIKCCATVELRHDEGGLWRVEIDVNEDQKQYARYIDMYSAVYEWFDTSLDYDESERKGCLCMIDSLSAITQNYTGVYRVVSSDFSWTSGTKPEGLHFESAVSSDGPWTDDANVTATSYGTFTVPIASAAAYYRVRWNDNVSNVMERGHIYTNTGTLSAPLFFSTVFRARYNFDVPNFNKENVLVFVMMQGETHWTDVTDACAILNDTIYFDAIQTKTSCFTAQLHYSANNIYTNEAVSNSCNGAASITSVDGRTIYYHTDLTGFDSTKLGVSYSNDGENWSSTDSTGLTITSDSVTYQSGTLIDQATYVALAYNGYRASDYYKRADPYDGENHELHITGVVPYNGDYVQLNVDSEIESTESEIVVQIATSTDGITWTNESSETGLSGGGYISGSVISVDTHPISTACYIRLSANGFTSQAIKWPMN